MNSELDRYNKENLGEAGMKILDMRVDIEDAIDMINQTRVKMDMILFSLKMMEEHVRDNLPEFTMDYNDYKKMIEETRNELTVDYSEMVTDE
jgi:Ni,Fe-hydrogenase III large subunit